MKTEQRQRLVTCAVNLTANTPLAPSIYERDLLQQYVRGVLTINQVVALLDQMQTQPESAANGAAPTRKATPDKRPAARADDGSRTHRRGFASMDADQQRQIASQGGRAAAAAGRGHKWTAEQAREAGRKGGLVSRRGAKPKP